MESALHRQLIEQAGQAGWIRAGLDSDWRAAFYKKVRERRWSGKSDEFDIAIKSKVLHPDAYRMIVEGEETGHWNYDVLVLEFLEVEVTGHMSAGKKRAYERLWYYFDATDRFAFRVFHMDRFGTIRPFLTEQTIYTWRHSGI